MQLRFDVAALEEIAAAKRYDAAERAALAAEFDDALREAFALIPRNPRLWTPLSRRTRRYAMGRFPYSIVHRARGDEVLVVAVAHQSRRQNYWRGR